MTEEFYEREPTEEEGRAMTLIAERMQDEFRAKNDPIHLRVGALINVLIFEATDFGLEPKATANLVFQLMTVYQSETSKKGK